MIDNDWNHTEPEANYQGWGSLLPIRRRSLLLQPPLKLFEKDICFLFFFLVHTSAWYESDKRGRHREALFTPCEAGQHPMIPVREAEPDSSDVCQYGVEHEEGYV